MKTTTYCLLLAATIFISFTSFTKMFQSNCSFTISYQSDKSDKPLDGRMLLMLSKNDKEEPRFQINSGPKGQLVFGVNVENLKGGEEVIVDAEAFGYPIESLKDVPPGEYYVQALFHLYETFHRLMGMLSNFPWIVVKDNNGDAHREIYTVLLKK